MRLELPRVINGAGPVTRLAGSPLSPEVVQAMADAAVICVSMDDAHAIAARRIRELTGAEGGLVTAGAAASLTLGAAAILANQDSQQVSHERNRRAEWLRRFRRMESLPDTQDMRSRFLVAREHRNGYDHAVRAAGAALTEVGVNEVASGAGVRQVEAWEYEAAIDEQSVGVLYVATPNSRPSLREVVELADRHNLAVLVDAAGQLPPRDNLQRFIDEGADLVAMSGGKAIRGPQNSGLLFGKRELIVSATLQAIDTDDHFAIWDPPADWIPKDELPGIPRHGIGRALKVTKESIAGLLVALEQFMSSAVAEARREAARRELAAIAEKLADFKGVACEARDDKLSIFVTDQSPMDAWQLCVGLRQHQPAIFLGHAELDQHCLVVNPASLLAGDGEQIGNAIRLLLEP